MQQRIGLAAAGEARDRRGFPGRTSVSEAGGRWPLPAKTESTAGQSLSSEAVAHPAAMARLILRRVGIKPLLPMLALCPGILTVAEGTVAEAAERSSTRVAATARVQVVNNAARLQQGRLIIADAPSDHSGLKLSPPIWRERPCPAEDGIDPHPACRLMIADLP